MKIGRRKRKAIVMFGYAFVPRLHDPETLAPAPAKGLTRRPSADVLRPYRGQWVVVANGRIMFSGSTATDALTQLRNARQTAESIFWVPLEPAVDRRVEL